MNRKSLHPNTNTLLSAWQRMSTPHLDTSPAPRTSDHPDLIECLFVLEQTDQEHWVFKNAGSRLSKLIGQEMGERDYLELWTGHDRTMVGAFLHAVIESRLPGVMRARGETLTGVRIDLELTIAPLPRTPGKAGGPRLIGLYQTLGGDGLLNGRPVWRHRVTEIYPPHLKDDGPRLRLVANSD